MTWLSISLKNAAACDKWYQLQNHFITESLNANGAWEKPFVGHPRACYSQCRTNKKKPPEVKFRFSLFKLRARAQARHIHLCVAVWLGVCCVRGLNNHAVPSREAGAAKRVPKETLRFLFVSYNSYLVYRPEHGRTTRRT